MKDDLHPSVAPNAEPRLRPKLFADPRTDVVADSGETHDSSQGGLSSWGHLAPCLFYLMVEFGRPQAWFPPLAAIRPGMIAAIWGLLAVLTVRHAKVPLAVKLMLAFAGLIALGVPFARNNYWALMAFRDFLVFVLGGVLPLAVLPRSIGDVRFLLYAYVLLHVPTAIYGLMNGGRGVGGWLGDENDLALAMNVSIGIGIHLFFSQRRPQMRALLLVSLVLLVAAVVVGKSRGGFVGLVSVFVVLIAMGPHRGKSAGVTLLAALGLAVFAPPTFWDEVRSIKSANQEGDTGEARIYYWKFAWRMFTEHPVIGVGADNFGVVVVDYEDKLQAALTGQHIWGRVTHSLYFTLLPEHGLIGVALFVALLWWWVRAHRRIGAVADELGPEAGDQIRSLTMGMFVGLCAFLTTGIFISVLRYPPMWVLFGVLAGLEQLVLSQRRATRPALTEADLDAFSGPLPGDSTRLPS